METQTISYFELKGSYHEIGKQMAKRLKAVSALEFMKVPAPELITEKEFQEAREIYQKYCPGVLEEMEGFTEESGIPMEQVAYYWMTYLVPRCSGLMIDAKKSADGHCKLVRNYEFSIGDEDLTVSRTVVDGKYAHISSNIVCFGRCDGINECGLAITQSSCGFPVSNMQGMRPPKVKGLQFWAAIRTVLENCKNVEEALNLLNEMPIGYNINLLLADASGNGALFETMDGHRATQRLEDTKGKDYLAATNHIAIPEFQVYEPVGMRNSIIRLQNARNFAESKEMLTEDEIKQFMLTKYPNGMTCHYYKDWFGTIRTVVMDPMERRYSICWFGLNENGWSDFYVNEAMPDRVEEKAVISERGTKEMFEMIPIE